MKQILLMMPSYYQFDEVIVDGLVKYSGAKVNSIDTSTKIAYRHFGDRIFNFLSKVFLNRNLKPNMLKKRMLWLISKLNKIDYLIINRVDLVDASTLNAAIKKSQHKILLLWDSVEKVPVPTDRMAFFNTIYSFDSDDCFKYGFTKIENFHFRSNESYTPFTYDVAYLGTFDNRHNDLEKIIAHLKNIGKSVKASLYIPSGKKIKSSKEIEVLEKIVPFKESIFFAKQGMVILDLAHKTQKGLSFRFFEAMLLKKKIITTNRHVRMYDFYRRNNIFIIENIEDITIPEKFWTTTYEDLSQEIIEKYTIESWVKRILLNE